MVILLKQEARPEFLQFFALVVTILIFQGIYW